MIRAVTTDYLSDAAKMIREEVFMREQGFRHEFDEIDAKAVCLVLYEESKPMACGRYFPGEADGEYVAGRLAVLREYRGGNGKKDSGSGRKEDCSVCTGTGRRIL